MYIGINNFSVSASDHKPQHVAIQNSTGSCLYIHLTSRYMGTFKLNVNVLQIFFNVTNKVQ